MFLYIPTIISFVLQIGIFLYSPYQLYIRHKIVRLALEIAISCHYPHQAGVLGVVALELMVARAKVIGKESARFGYSEQMRLGLSCFVSAAETLSRAYSLEHVMVSNVGTSK